MTWSYRDSHMHKGAEYEESFHTIPHRAMMWRLEQRAIESLVRRFLPGGVGDYLDFACGTGRVLALLSPRATRATGLDISPTMLEVARGQAPAAEIICGDLTREPLLGNRQFDLITAFRFFPNAEDDLRREAMERLATHLRPGGILILNNHRNPHSSVRIALRALGREGEEPAGSRLMRHAEVADLVGAAGLRIVRQEPLGSIPMDEGYFYGPPGLVEASERLLSRIPLTWRLAQNVVYACRRA